VRVNALVTFPTGDPEDMAALTGADKQRLAASSGGHFPALEVPDLLTRGIREFFGSVAS
jgi:hypothetical protein